MPARRLNDVVIVSIAGALLVLLGVVGAILAPPAEKGALGTSTFSAAPSGTKAVYLTLRELGYNVERSLEPITALRTDPASTLLIITGDQEPPSDQDRRALKQFFDGGGTLLAIGANGADFLGFGRGGGARAALFGDEQVDTYRPLMPSALTAGADRITMNRDVSFVKFSDAYAPVYGNSPEQAVIATARIGIGRAIWWAAPTPLTNGQIAKADNFRLVLNVVGAPGERQVLFDEHYQGHRRSLWSYAVGTPLPWVALQVGLVGLAAFLTFSRRSGPVRPRTADPRTSPMEFVDMLGALYKRAGAHGASVSAARTRLRRTIAATCGVPATSEDVVLAQAAASKLGTDVATIADLLAESERSMRDPHLEVERALELTRQLQALTARLQAVRGWGAPGGGVN